MFFSLPVLMYHSISRFQHRLCVSPELFEEHCKTLADAGWRGISLAEAEDYFFKKRRLPGRVCLFSFDDGYLDNYVYAEPILRQYGHHGVLFPVVDFIGKEEVLRPTLESLKENPERVRELPDLDRRATINRSRLPVYQITFCNWQEIRHMHHDGNLASAAHSMRHDRVVRSLEFNRLYTPGGRGGFFGVPPYASLWGLPRFDLGHGLAYRGYELAPELFELVQRMVPQEANAAKAFLAKEENRQAVHEAVGKLSCLGTLESEASYRARIFQEFTECREVFTKQLGTPPISFCWPWGDYNRIALEEARKAGFKVFFTTRRGVNLRSNALAVRRFAVRGGSGQELLKKIRFVSNPFLEAPYGLWRKGWKFKWLGAVLK